MELDKIIEGRVLPDIGTPTQPMGLVIYHCETLDLSSFTEAQPSPRVRTHFAVGT